MKVVFRDGRMIPGIGSFNPGDTGDLPESMARELIGRGVCEKPREPKTTKKDYTPSDKED
jgi:hypothetical protein